MFEIRFCRVDEIDMLQDFINKHWKKDHILVNNIELLRWQHYDKKNDRYNFIVAYDENDRTFDGILGFIPANHYDESINNSDIWLAIWKINEEKTKGKLSGMDLLYFLKRQLKPDSIGAIGISDIALNIYDILKYKTGNLNQYYILNRLENQFTIADVNARDKYEEVQLPEGNYHIKKITNIEELKGIKNTYKPYKSLNYIKNRYINHPIYKYAIYGIYNDKLLVCAVITRKIRVADAYCIRILDIYGSIEGLGNINAAMQQLLVDEDAEYLDCLNYGIDEEDFYKLGFKKRDDKIIIPNYFEPFIRQNVDIRFGYKSKYDEYIIFKGDSDQDRPNLV